MEDSGPGIPERERAAVFERGVRGSTSVGVDGTGLGLFVSRRLMAEQHGNLRLRSGAAGGACFVLDLPAAVSDPVPSAPDVLELTDVDLRRPVQLEGPIFVPGQPKPQPGERVKLVRVHHHRDES